MNFKKYLLVLCSSVTMIESTIAVETNCEYQLTNNPQEEFRKNAYCYDYFSYLPNELINEIVKNLHSSGDKLEFMRSCKRNRDAVLRNIADEKSTITLVSKIGDIGAEFIIEKLTKLKSFKFDFFQLLKNIS